MFCYAELLVRSHRLEPFAAWFPPALNVPILTLNYFLFRHKPSIATRCKRIHIMDLRGGCQSGDDGGRGFYFYGGFIELVVKFRGFLFAEMGVDIG